MKKICLVHPNLEKGGAETQILQNVEFLSLHGSLSVILFDDPSGVLPSLSKRFPLVKFYCVGRRTGLLRGVHLLLRVTAFIREVKPNILISFLVHANLICLLAGKFCRTQKIIWGLRTSAFSLTEFGLKGACAHLLSITFSPMVDCLIANNEKGLQQFLTSGARPKRYITIPNGVDSKRFSPCSERGANQRRQLGISDNAIVVGIVARLVPWKGYDNLLRSIAEIRLTNPHLKLLCVGGGLPAYTRSCQELTHNLSIQAHVTWAGCQEAVDDFLDMMDIFVLPSISGEGFSNALTEAMAKQLPCVVTDIGDSKTILDRCGLVVPPDDTDQLTIALRYLISDSTLRRALGVRARKRVMSEYSIEACHTNLYNALFVD